MKKYEFFFILTIKQLYKKKNIITFFKKKNRPLLFFLNILCLFIFLEFYTYNEILNDSNQINISNIYLYF